MRFIHLPIIISLISIAALSAFGHQSDQVLIRIDDRQITKAEFLEIYKRNNLESVIAETKEVDEYLEMYINFRLKVKAAKDQGLDTLSSFVDELQGYRDQLAQQYLVDHEVTEKLIEEAWERSQYDVRASHILIELPEHAAPEDTLEVYEQMKELRERALAGESFGDLARDYSDDPSADGRPARGDQPARRGNAGDLGYFTVFNMVYPFESAAYKTSPGDISMPFRTSFGYHIVKVTDRLPAMGRARVAHIMLMTPQDASSEELADKEEQIFELHQKLMDEGADFEELAAEYSEDQQSAQRGGEMAPFTSNRMVPQFIEAISKMHEEGDISPPVRTDFGWHIIKLLKKDTPPDFEEAYTDLQNRIQRDDRSRLSQQVVVERLKDEYDLQKEEEALQAFYEAVDESIFEGAWDSETATRMNDVLFSFADRSYTQKDFAEYLDDHQRNQNPTTVRGLVNHYLDQMIAREILAYEEKNLEEKYDEFRKVMQEYHDGILLFEITNQEVWSKATADTTGLKAFFEANQEQYGAAKLSEVRGTVIADYQEELENEWLEKLRRKYEVWVDKELLESILEDESYQQKN